MTEKDRLQNDEEITIGDLYPNLSPEQQREAEFHLLGYLAVVKEIFGQIIEDNPYFLTELERRAKLKKEGNSSRTS